MVGEVVEGPGLLCKAKQTAAMYTRAEIQLRQTRSADNSCFMVATAAGARRQRSGSAHAIWAAVLRLLVAAQLATHDRRARGFAGSVLQVDCSSVLAQWTLPPACMLRQEQSAFETVCSPTSTRLRTTQVRFSLCSQIVCSSHHKHSVIMPSTGWRSG